MNKSTEITNIAKALLAFQKEVKDPARDEDNPFFKSKYVPIDKLLVAIRPVLAKHGLSFIQAPGGDGERISVTTLLMHESGEWIESGPFVMKAQKTDPQGAGSAVTYGRRYSLSAVLGVAWDSDDDGNKASGNEKQLMPGVVEAKKEMWEGIITLGAGKGIEAAAIGEHAAATFKAKNAGELSMIQMQQLKEWVMQQ